ncbi:hypothetical protein PM082_021960 [Marasmius tenuissimus]|nr:hypothetical protein PM082_021960 [Marasmius tenuissimus]
MDQERALLEKTSLMSLESRIPSTSATVSQLIPTQTPGCRCCPHQRISSQSRLYAINMIMAAARVRISAHWGNVHEPA